MRPYLAQLLHAEMKKNSAIWVVSGDLGYGMWDQIRSDYPARFINVGAAEQAMVGISVGLALEGKIPFVYSITPFLLYRPFETIRNYLHHEQIPVKLLGSGRDREYHNEGFSHWAEEDRDIMHILGGIESHWPADNGELEHVFQRSVSVAKPFYINLKKT